MAERHARVLTFVSEHPWAILEARLQSIIEVLQLRAEGVMFTDEEIQARIGARRPETGGQVQGMIAVLPLHGVIAPRMNVMTDISGGTSAEQFGKAFRHAVADPNINGILLDVDSPGGSVFGMEELAATIRAGRGSKPIVAVANTMMASAAYWIGSQADEILASPSSQVGSIGVIGIHQDLSAAAAKAGVKTTFVSAGKFKTEGNSFEPLGDEARAAMQKQVDSYYTAFTRDVARGRGVKAAAVREGFGEGRVVSATEAAQAGMVDGVATFDQAIERVAGRMTGRLTASTRGRLITAVEPGEEVILSLGSGPGALFRIDGERAQVDPNEDGTCPDGYEKHDDDMCHLIPEEAKAAKAAVEDLRKQLAARGA